MVVLDGYGLLQISSARLPADPELLRFRPLTMEDQPAICTLEDMAFPNPLHRATREKISYRITNCSDISYGLFTRLHASSDPLSAMARLRQDQVRPLLTMDEDGGGIVLLAHAISSMGNNPIVTDRDMSIPENWRDAETIRGPPVGHQPGGRTLCLHSFAVVPEVQRMGIGALVLRAYIRLMYDSGCCDRVALVCQNHFIPFYQSCGFTYMGASAAEFGGGGWYNMVIEF